MNPFDLLLPKPDDIQAHVSLKLGTIAPGGVVLEGGTVPSSAAISLVDPLSPGDKVLVAMQGRRVYILGVVQGGSTPAMSVVLEKLALASSQQVPIAFVGDSEVVGMSLQAVGYKLSWPTLLGNLLGTVVGEWYRPQNTWGLAPDPRWIFGPGAGFDGGVGAFAFGPRVNLDVGEWVEFDGDRECTEVKVAYLNSGLTAATLGEFSISIDGGSPVTVTPSGATTLGKWSSGPLSPGPHHVRIENIDATYSSIITGIYNGSAGNGIVLNQGGYSGTNSGQWDVDTHMSLWGTLIALEPDPEVIFVSIGVNDAVGSATVGDYETNLESILDKALLKTPAVVVVTQPHASSVAHGRWDDFRAVARAAAEDRGLPVIDVTERWGYYPGNEPGLYADGTHPSRDGYAKIAQLVAQGIGVLPA